MAIDLTTFAKENGIKYFMISFADLFGGQEPSGSAQAIADMQVEGAGFTGFATRRYDTGTSRHAGCS